MSLVRVDLPCSDSTIRPQCSQAEKKREKEEEGRGEQDFSHSAHTRFELDLGKPTSFTSPPPPPARTH